MAVTIQINSVDKSEFINWESLECKQNLNNLVDTAKFKTRKFGDRTFKPEFNDDIKVYDGAICIFAGTILRVNETVESGGGGVVYEAEAVDYSYQMDKLLVARTYENKTVLYIITDILSSYASDFDADNVESAREVEKIVFNQVPTSQCIQRLADTYNLFWYVDENKSVHLFDKNSNSAPFNLTDISGNFVYQSLARVVDGSLTVNTVKVRGGEYDGASYTDVITVKGSDSKSFVLSKKMANLVIELNTGAGYVAKDVGVDFIDDFTTVDVLYSYQTQSIRFENPLTDGNKIRYTGNPKVRVFAISQEPNSVSAYGKIEKLVRDDNIRSNAVARQRANAESLALNVPIVDASFYTYESGLRAGQVLNLASVRRDCDDNLLIKALTFKMVDPEHFGYKVDLVSTKRFELIDFLQKLVQPVPLSTDETEVAEDIFADPAEVTIQEEHENVSPQEDFADVQIQESILLNPIDPDTIEWVWGPYFPTSDADPKRAPKWSRGAKWL
ncbi:MAG: hypothetical protein NTZ18_03620 [Candidatus Komeilibacteria bacterium]|nr:hypothetical protein [Candidatus Komeilibacteria bacterium]